MNLVKKHTKPWVVGLFLLLFIIVSGIYLTKGYCYLRDSYKVNVSGMIYAKDRRPNVYNCYVMAISPFDKKYNNYSITVDFSVYSNYNIGDTISCRMYKPLVTEDTNLPPEWVVILAFLGLCVLGIIGIIYSGLLLLSGNNWE